MASIRLLRLNFVKNVCLNYYSQNLVLVIFRGDSARVIQQVSMNLNMMVGQAACQLLCRYTQSTLAASCVYWIVPIVMCDPSKELVAVHVWNAPDQWHDWRVAGVRISPPVKLNAKPGPDLGCILVFTILLVPVDCCFFTFFGMFSGDFGFLYSRSIPELLLFFNYFQSVSQWVPFN